MNELQISLSLRDAQALYDHTGTMPYAPDSWSNNVRDALSEALHYAREDAWQKGGKRDAGAFYRPTQKHPPNPRGGDVTLDEETQNVLDLVYEELGDSLIPVTELPYADALREVVEKLSQQAALAGEPVSGSSL